MTCRCHPVGDASERLPESLCSAPALPRPFPAGAAEPGAEVTRYWRAPGSGRRTVSLWRSEMAAPGAPVTVTVTYSKRPASESGRAGGLISSCCLSERSPRRLPRCPVHRAGRGVSAPGSTLRVGPRFRTPPGAALPCRPRSPRTAPRPLAAARRPA